MNPPPLLASTGNAQADEILLGLIGLCEMLLPGRIRGVYLTGSHADGTAVDTSDLDLFVLLKQESDPEDQQKLDAMLDCCQRLCPLDLDVHVLNEARRIQQADLLLKSGSLLLHGEDIRPQIQLPPLEEYTRFALHGPYRFLARIRGNPRHLPYPLDLPDPAGECFGYDDRPMRGRDGVVTNGTKELVVSTGWIATALLALQAGQMVARKADCVRAYQEHIGDRWAPLLAQIHRKLRHDWGYRVPEAPADRQLLRALARQALDFENHFLSVYRQFLLRELRHPDAAIQLLALQRLERILFRDEEVLAILQDLEHAPSEPLRTTATRILQNPHPTPAPQDS